MKPPTVVSQSVYEVLAIHGGGPSEDGSDIVIEFRMKGGQMLPFRFSRRLTDKLISAAQRFLYEARKRKRGATNEVDSAVGALLIKSSMLSFQLNQDGSDGRIVIQGPDAPRISIELLPEDFPLLRDQLDNIERKMAAARKPKQH